MLTPQAPGAATSPCRITPLTLVPNRTRFPFLCHWANIDFLALVSRMVPRPAGWLLSPLYRAGRLSRNSSEGPAEPGQETKPREEIWVLEVVFLPFCPLSLAQARGVCFSTSGCPAAVQPVRPKRSRGAAGVTGRPRASEHMHLWLWATSGRPLHSLGPQCSNRQPGNVGFDDLTSFPLQSRPLTLCSDFRRDGR